MEAWSGRIERGDGDHCLTGEQAAGTASPLSLNPLDVHLYSPDGPPSRALSPHSSLRFLAVVDIPSVPLYLISGSCFEVWSNNTLVEQWITDSLQPDEEEDSNGVSGPTPWWHKGILLRVVDEAATGEPKEQSISELLLYAESGEERNNIAGLTTPPDPSSPGPFEGNQDEKTFLRLYALPLCSHRVQQVKQWSNHCPSSIERLDCGQAAAGAESQLSSRKRQRVSSLFEDATQQRRQLKRRGGERISMAMAEFERPGSSHGLSNMSRPPSGDMVQQKARPSPSLPDWETINNRPAPLNKTKSLQRAESTMSLQSQSPQPEFSNPAEQQNKATLSKVVMAAMRLYGLQQGKKSDQSDAHDYKLVYHQTFKAAAFTFRSHITIEPVSQVAMRDIVDRLLALFCIDPLHKDGSGFSEATSFVQANGSAAVERGQDSCAKELPLASKRKHA